LGLRQTLWLASGVNLLVGACACVLGWGEGPKPQASEAPPLEGMPPGGTRLALAGAALTGTAGLGLEVVWARVLGILTSNSAYGFALLLTVLLLGLAAGSLLQAWWSRRPGDP